MANLMDDQVQNPENLDGLPDEAQEYDGITPEQETVTNAEQKLRRLAAEIGHNDWLAGQEKRILGYPNKSVYGPAGLEENVRTSMTLFGTMEYVAERITVVANPEGIDDLVEKNGKFYHVTITPREFLDKHIENLTKKVQEDKRLEVFLQDKELAFVRMLVNRTMGNKVEITCKQDNLSQEQAQKLFNEWMVELGIDRIHDNDAWGDTVLGVMRSDNIDVRDVVHGNLSPTSRLEILELETGIKNVWAPQNSTEMTEMLNQNKQLLQAMAIAHGNWRKLDGFLVGNDEAVTIHTEVSEIMTDQERTRIAHRNYLIGIANTNEDQLRDVVTQLRKDYENERKNSVMDSFQFIFMIVKTLEDINTPQSLEIARHQLDEIRYDANIAITETVRQLYEQSGSDFMNGIKRNTDGTYRLLTAEDV